MRRVRIEKPKPRRERWWLEVKRQVPKGFPMSLLIVLAVLIVLDLAAWFGATTRATAVIGTSGTGADDGRTERAARRRTGPRAFHEPTVHKT